MSFALCNATVNDGKGAVKSDGALQSNIVGDNSLQKVE